MMISSTTRVAGSASDPRKANIERQIRKLEKKKQELFKKLAGNKESASDQKSPSLQNANVRVSGQQTANQGSIGSGTASLDAASPISAGGGKVVEMQQLFNELRAGMSAGADDSAVAAEDPKEILKQIQVIEMQILMLRQQLGEDASTLLTAEAEGENAESESIVAAAFQKLAGGDLPVAEAAGGHVDGYA